MKRTFQPKKRHRATKHGFLARSKSSNGRKVLAAFGPAFLPARANASASRPGCGKKKTARPAAPP